MAEGRTAAPHIVWFKRDLRRHDHGPLWHASQQSAPIIPLYIVEPNYWKQPFASRRHWRFIHDCLTDLNQGLLQLGQPLVVRVGEASDVIQELHNQCGVAKLWAHEETADLWTFERDKAVWKTCANLGIQVQEFPTNGVVRRLKSRDNWSVIRNRRVSATVFPRPNKLIPATDVEGVALPSKDKPIFGAQLPETNQKGGRRRAVEDLQSFLEERSSNYLRHISAPGASEFSCSRLSAHLAFGALSTREVVQALDRRRKQLSPIDKSKFARNLSAFGSRLAWRCHFIQKLEDQPSIETNCMHPAFEGLREKEHREDYFEAWKTGKTGIPFVDACMRNLISTGWITFRMRAMLVSFASYQLWLDWRKTAPYLAGLFTDYEPGIHYSQFQMQSGVTGINAIRIYNPIKQGLDQDPNGIFVRKWVPELRHIMGEAIHQPWLQQQTLFRATSDQNEATYPAPIVDLTLSAKAAKDKLAAVRKSDAFFMNKYAVYIRHGSRKRTTKSKGQKPAPDQLKLF